MKSTAGYEIFLTLLYLLSTAQAQTPQYREVILINQLNAFFGFDHNVFVMDSSTDHCRYIATSSNCGSKECSNTPRSVYIFKQDSDNLTELATLHEIKSKNKFLIVVTNIVEFESSLKLLSQVKKIRLLNTNVKIGVFFAQNVASMDIIEKLFQWSWKHRILNIFAAFYLNEEDLVDHSPLLNVFKFNPLGIFDLVNMTGSESFQNYFADELSNWHKYPLRLANMDGLRMTFVDSQLWKTVTDSLNASSSMIGNYSWEGIQAVDDDDVFDILPYKYSTKQNSEIIKIFPLGIDTLIMLVPHASPYSGFGAYLFSITSENLFGYTIIMIASASLVLIVSGYLKTKKILFFQCVADVLNLLMNDNGTIRYHQLCRSDVFVIVPLTFAGLIVVNGALSSFQSFLTSPIYQPQINTIEDLYKSPVPILVKEAYWASQVTEMLENLSRHGGWSDKVHPTGWLQQAQEIETFNKSIAFPAPFEEAQVLLEAQKRLNLKAYHMIPDTYLDKFVVTYFVNHNFPFIERINDVFLRLQNAGMITRWQERSYQFWIKGTVKNYIRLRSESGNISAIDESTVPTVLWLIFLWIGSFVVFICEVIWNKYQSSRIII